MNQEFCQIVGLVAAYLERHPDGADRLKAFMTGDKRGLWSTEDVCEYTGFGRTQISMWCNTGKIPYIPGRPNRFNPQSVKDALKALETAPALYGRRKFKPKTKGGTR